ncbi:MAG: dihydroneopterin aldolase [Proteobacteria bacterium]|nr:dihydroneopterin aldolase [Pseudomonadota bacterium]
MDKLRVHGLAVSALIGVHAWERQVRQRLLIDLEIETDASRAAAADQLADAIDYGTIARRVTAIVAAAEHRLIETLAETIAQSLLDEYALRRIRIVVHKPGAIPDATDTSIEIERSR